MFHTKDWSRFCNIVEWHMFYNCVVMQIICIAGIIKGNDKLEVLYY